MPLRGGRRGKAKGRGLRALAGFSRGEEDAARRRRRRRRGFFFFAFVTLVDGDLGRDGARGRPGSREALAAAVFPGFIVELLRTMRGEAKRKEGL